MTKEEQICISAVRYALGRRTYIVPITVDFMIAHKLGQECKYIMKRDIEEAIGRGEVGQECDLKDWERLKEHLSK